MGRASISVCERCVFCCVVCRTDLARVTEFKPRDQLSASTSVASQGKKTGGLKRRTKREIISPPGESQSAPKKRWPCLVRSPTYDPNYPTFCECLQPHCSYHCPTARGILTRGCTTYSWPAPEIMSYGDWPLLAEPYANHDTGIEAGNQRGHIENHGACKCVPFPTLIC